MPTRRANGTATLLPDGRVLAAGGYGTDWQAAEVLDPDAGQWILPSTLPVSGREGHSANLLNDGRVLMAGGHITGVQTTTSCATFNSSQGTWTPVQGLAQGRTTHKAVTLLDGRVLVAGGEGPLDNYLASAELFDPALGTWSDA